MADAGRYRKLYTRLWRHPVVGRDYAEECLDDVALRAAGNAGVTPYLGREGAYGK